MYPLICTPVLSLVRIVSRRQYVADSLDGQVSLRVVACLYSLPDHSHQGDATYSLWAVRFRHPDPLPDWLLGSLLASILCTEFLRCSSDPVRLDIEHST